MAEDSHKVAISHMEVTIVVACMAVGLSSPGQEEEEEEEKQSWAPIVFVAADPAPGKEKLEANTFHTFAVRSALPVTMVLASGDHETHVTFMLCALEGPPPAESFFAHGQRVTQAA